jgi:hypothetical protein
LIEHAVPILPVIDSFCLFHNHVVDGGPDCKRDGVDSSGLWLRIQKGRRSLVGTHTIVNVAERYICRMKWHTPTNHTMFCT